MSSRARRVRAQGGGGIAGKDDQFEGQLQKAAGIVVSHLEQEPLLDDGATVDDNIQPAVKRVRNMVADFEQARSLRNRGRPTDIQALTSGRCSDCWVRAKAHLAGLFQGTSSQ